MKTHSIRPKMLAAGAVLLLVAGVLILLFHSTNSRMFSTVIPLSTSDMQPAGGVAFSASNATLGKALRKALHPRSAVTENGTALPTRCASSQRVREGAGGDFSFGQKKLWFSATDSSDPRTNGRHYEAVLLLPVPIWLVAAAWAALLAGALLLIRARFRIWAWSAWTIRPPSAVSGQSTHKRESGLDVLRAVAVLLVLVAHAEPCPAQGSKALNTLTTHIGSFGAVGVDLFFVLSGYLVSGLLFAEFTRTGTLHTGRFLMRRGLKIYPAHWFMVITTLVVASFGFAPKVTPDKVMGDILYLQNYIGGGTFEGGSLWVHTWTLAVEEHFYLLLAAVFALALAARKRDPTFSFVPRLFLVIAVSCLSMRCLRAAYGESLLQNYLYTHLRLDGLMFGVLLRHVRESSPARFAGWAHRLKWAGLAALPLMLLPSFLTTVSTSKLMLTVGFCGNYLGAGCLLLSFTAWEQSKMPWLDRLCRPVALAGRHSYSIYLWHMPMAVWVAGPVLSGGGMTASPLTNWYAYLGVYYLAIIGTGILLSVLIEQPVLHLRDHFFPSYAKERACEDARPGHTGCDPNEGTRQSCAATPLLQPPASTT